MRWTDPGTVRPPHVVCKSGHETFVFFSSFAFDGYVTYSTSVGKYLVPFWHQTRNEEGH